MIKIIVDGQSLRWYDRAPKVAADSVEFVKFKFLLSEEWDDHVVVAQFSQKGATYNKVLEDGCCTLPVEIEDGKCFISIFGQIPGGPERATVIPLLTDVSLSGFVGNGETPIPPTPDLYSQLIDYFSKHSSGGSGAVSPEDIAQAVEDYLTEHPVEGVGKPGYSPTVEVTNTEKGTKVVITDVNGPHDFEIPDGVSGVYVLAEGEALEDAPEDANVVIDPFGEPDEEPSPSTGNGIPAGGKAGQYLCKQSDDDYDVAWTDLVIPEQYGLITYDQTKTITVT